MTLARSCSASSPPKIESAEVEQDWHVANQQFLFHRLGQVRQRLVERGTVDEPDRVEADKAETVHQRECVAQTSALPPLIPPCKGGKLPPLSFRVACPEDVGRAGEGYSDVVEKDLSQVSADQEVWDHDDHVSAFALEVLSRHFQLNEFERNILLLCAGMELDGQWPELCRRVSGHAYPTFGLALALFDNSLWESLTPKATLRQWQLIDVDGGQALINSPLRINERILHYLTGVQYLDQRLQSIVTVVHTFAPLVPSHQVLIDRIERTWTQRSPGSPLPVIQLVGSESSSLRTVASAACHQLGLALRELSAEALPTDWQQLHTLKILCEREYKLSGMILLLNCEELGTESAERKGAIASFIDTLNVPLIMSSGDRRRQRQRPIVSLEVQHPTAQEQRQLWQIGLGRGELGEGELGDRAIQNEVSTDGDGVSKAGTVDAIVFPLVSQFNLSSSAIQTICLQSQPTDSFHTLWDRCRQQVRPRLDELAQRIGARADWDSLVLPEREYQMLNTLAAHVAQRSRVYEEWGFGGKTGRGLGISALFAGASGTGKTTAAEVISRELNLDIYRIDLSAVVSKYIGETEKNLRRIFDAAEGGGVILLFDEADALFGKRSDVNDSKDRYANMEVSYLLQRMESYRGLAILTTNLKHSIDQAFLRRLRFVIQFPFPDTKQRAEIWRRVFPKNTPTEGLVYERLANLSIAGGNIRNIALSAAFIAAHANEPVQMKHVLQAAKQEYWKLERPLTDTEVKGWV